MTISSRFNTILARQTELLYQYCTLPSCDMQKPNENGQAKYTESESNAIKKSVLETYNLCDV